MKNSDQSGPAGFEVTGATSVTGASASATPAPSGLPQAVQDAELASSLLSRMLEGLAEKIGARADVRAVFGEQVSQGTITVIPVARVIGAFGAGAGAGTKTADEAGKSEAGAGPGIGGGGGGAFVAMPVGFIEIESGRARFRRFDEGPPSVTGVAGVPGLAIGLAVQGVRLGLALWRKRRAAKSAAQPQAAAPSSG
ncbi:MAG TPA: hypothetical protein VF331_25020 [Polyangiales bacterium]